MQKRVFGHIWTAKAQLSLRICAVWSGPSLTINRIIGYHKMFQWKIPGWDFALVQYDVNSHILCLKALLRLKRPYFCYLRISLLKMTTSNATHFLIYWILSHAWANGKLLDWTCTFINVMWTRSWCTIFIFFYRASCEWYTNMEGCSSTRILVSFSTIIVIMIIVITVYCRIIGINLAEAVITSTHNLCFEQQYEKYKNVLSENFPFWVVKFSIYLNRRVFVMIWGKLLE